MLSVMWVWSILESVLWHLKAITRDKLLPSQSTYSSCILELFLYTWSSHCCVHGQQLYNFFIITTVTLLLMVILNCLGSSDKVQASIPTCSVFCSYCVIIYFKQSYIAIKCPQLSKLLRDCTLKSSCFY